MSLALVCAATGLAADPSSSSPDAAKHDSTVAAAVDAALAGATAGPTVGTPLPTASPADPSGSSGASSTPSPTPTPTPTPTITPPPRAATVNARVPSTVLSSLRLVTTDFPAPYHDGCHVVIGGRMPAKSCLYGNLASRTTVAIYGDSHALSWFPAILRMVNSHGWRLLEVTMAACTPSDITPYAPSTGVMTACITFRKAAIAKLRKYHPTVIIVAGTRGFETVDRNGHVLTGAARTTAWVAGMYRTINALLPATSRLVLMADTPNSRYSSPPGCLAAHPTSELACATPVSSAISYTWLNTEFHVALRKRVAFIDPERWVCPTSPCPLVRGTNVVYRNAGHITAKYAATMWRKLDAAVSSILAKPGTIVGP